MCLEGITPASLPIADDVSEFTVAHVGDDLSRWCHWVNQVKVQSPV